MYTSEWTWSARDPYLVRSASAPASYGAHGADGVYGGDGDDGNGGRDLLCSSFDPLAALASS